METILLEQVSRTPQVALSEITPQVAHSEIGRVLSCIHPDHVKGFEFDVFEDSVTVKFSEAAFDALAIKAHLHVESFRYHSHEIWQAQLGGVTIRTIRPVGASRTAGDDLSGCVVYP